MFIKRLFVLLLAVFFSACVLPDISDFTPDDTTAADDDAGVGYLRVLLTDNPLEGVDEVNVTFESIKVQPGQSDEWIVLSDSPGTFDLLKLQNGIVEEMGLSELAAGSYTGLLLVISEAWLVIDGEDVELPVSSSAEGGLIVQYTLSVTANTETVVVLDFDAEQSVHRTEDGFVLEPVVIALGTTKVPADEPPAQGTYDGEPMPEVSHQPVGEDRHGDSGSIDAPRDTDRGEDEGREPGQSGEGSDEEPIRDRDNEGDVSLETVSCVDIVECGILCDPNDMNCLTECLAGGSPESQSLATDVYTCWVEYCADTGETFRECMPDHCVNEVHLCEAASVSAPGNGGDPSNDNDRDEESIRDGEDEDDTGTPPIPGGSHEHTSTCGEILDCGILCDPSDMNCLGVCLSDGSAESQSLALDVYTCAMNNCSSAASTEACMAQYCEDEVVACMEDESGTSSGDATDSDEDDDWSDEREHGEDEDEDGDGPGSLAPIPGDSSSEEATCMEIVECGMGCAPNDFSCIGACLSEGSSESQGLASDMYSCYMSNCQSAVSLDYCMEANCPDETLACVEDSDGFNSEDQYGGGGSGDGEDAGEDEEADGE